MPSRISIGGVPRSSACAPDDSSSTEPDGESVTESHAELAQCLAPLIHGLAEKYSEALRLTEVEGLTQAAAAARLGLPPSTMKSRVQRGRARLKQALLTCCEVEVDRRGGVVEYAERAGRDDCPGC
jgi:RNA polymerase sigma-70 factor, ECF subfamily